MEVCCLVERLYELAENENIMVYDDYFPESISGLYMRRNKKQVLYLEKRLNHVHKRIVFAEELGHHFTSYGDTTHFSRSSFNTISKSEYRARKWAADFLIPEAEFAKLVAKSDHFYDLSIYDIAEEYGVTKEFLEFRWNSYFNRNVYS